MRDHCIQLVFLIGTLTLSNMEASYGSSDPTADRVLVVRNGNSSMSMAIADDYVRQRGAQHVLTIRCKDSSTLGNEVPNPNPFLRKLLGTKSETMDSNAYRREVETPIRAYLATHPGIDFIVLTKGIPIRMEGAGETGGIDRFSVDGHLAALDYDTVPHAIDVKFADVSYESYYLENFHEHFRAHTWANQFWNSHRRFSHVLFGGYLVTRLDGYKKEDAMALTERCLRAEQLVRAGKMPKGKVLLDIAPEWGDTGSARAPYNILSERKSPFQLEVTIADEKEHLGDFNSDIKVAADLLTDRGIPVDLDRSDYFVGNRHALMGYVSWGSNDRHFNNDAYHSLSFAPGAIAETAVSTSARTFLPTADGQSLIADLISQGVSGVKGYVDEPLVQAVAEPSILFDRYTRGWTLAESFYAASAVVGWEDVVIGDPLCRAYPSDDR